MVLMRTRDMHQLEIRRIRLETRMFISIIQIGLPAGLSSVMYSVSNLIIQSSVNSLGTNTVAAWTAYGKIDSIFWMIISAFGISLTTFVGQNFGAGKQERVKKGMKVCLAMSAATTVFVSIMIYFFGIYFYNLFTTDAVVKGIGIDILRYLVPFYITYILIEILSGSLRGVGDCWMPTILCFLGICMLRVVWLTTVVPAHRELHTILFSYPMTWSLTSTLYVIYFLFFSKLKVVKRKNA
jgi:Na+-driven multidrug efflux pump